MKLKVAEARQLSVAALGSIGFNNEDAEIVSGHLVDAALRGVTFGGLPRILAIAERYAETGDHRTPIETIHETSTSALMDGGDNVGYVVAYRATRLAIEKARNSGFAIVGANNTFYTGLFAYYMEMATREGFVALAIGNGPAHVAPEGSIEACLGTNPISLGFPSTSDAVIWDIGTSAIMHGEVQLHERLGQQLPEGVAIAEDGTPTRDPAAAIAGAFRAWGGHRGSGLAIAIQLLGAMCGGPLIAPGIGQMAYLVITIDPKLLLPQGDYPRRVSELSDAIRKARPVAAERPVRMPFDRSAAERRRRLRDDVIEIPDRVYDALVQLASEKTQSKATAT